MSDRQRSWGRFVPACSATLLLLAGVASAGAPAVHLLHVLSYQTPTQLCLEQGQPAGFYPPGQSPPPPAGSVILDPFSVHCRYADWLGSGPTTTVARGWPPTMAVITGICLGGIVGIACGSVVAVRRER